MLWCPLYSNWLPAGKPPYSRCSAMVFGKTGEGAQYPPPVQKRSRVRGSAGEPEAGFDGGAISHVHLRSE
jgi:hypothetical protein